MKGKKKSDHYRADETKLHGVNACLAAWRVRPKDVIKLYLTRERMAELAELVRWCVANRKAYKLVDDSELERLTASVHHEGICLIVKEPKSLVFEAALTQLKSEKGGSCVFYLDGVQNPHNVGNILRTAAHFGVPYLFTDQAQLAALPPSARRVSEGGAEFTRVVHCESAEKGLKALRAAGFMLVATSSHAAQDVYRAEIAERAVFIIGSEVSGTSKRVEALSDKRVSIPGTGHVESLNVASAAAILVSEHWRRFREAP